MPALYYLNPRLSEEECKKLDEQRLKGLRETIAEVRKNAEFLPPELRSQYMAVMMPIIATLL